MQALFSNFLKFFSTRKFYEGWFDDCFVDLSFPRAPVTIFIIIHSFESPATTFGLVKATRLTTHYVMLAFFEGTR